MLRIVEEVEARWVFIENSPNLRRYLNVVCGGLASLGYACRWGVIGARHAGAPHRRDRMWIVATHADREPIRDDEQRDARRRDDLQNSGYAESGDHGATRDVANADGERYEEHGRPGSAPAEHRAAERARWWQAEPDVGRVVDGMAYRVDRLRALGNGQVPSVAALAWRELGGPG
jgi:DNA (cytosine-5)-methyltransferase 1